MKIYTYKDKSEWKKFGKKKIQLFGFEFFYFKMADKMADSKKRVPIDFSNFFIFYSLSYLLSYRYKSKMGKFLFLWIIFHSLWVSHRYKSFFGNNVKTNESKEVKIFMNLKTIPMYFHDKFYVN